jgi:uncharacterized membrane protein YcaP (DUF421 family)
MLHALAPVASISGSLFDLQEPLLEKLLRSLGVFFFLVIALRLGGKREVGQLNVLDFAVLLLASNALQNAMIGDDLTLIGGLIGASTLFAANYAFVRLTFHNRRARRILEGEPRTLLEHGKPDREALDREAISVTELLSLVLERGFSGFRDVELVVLQPNGHLAVLGPEAAKQWRRRADSNVRV